METEHEGGLHFICIISGGDQVRGKVDYRDSGYFTEIEDNTHYQYHISLNNNKNRVE